MPPPIPLPGKGYFRFFSTVAGGKLFQTRKCPSMRKIPLFGLKILAKNQHGTTGERTKLIEDQRRGLVSRKNESKRIRLHRAKTEEVNFLMCRKARETSTAPGSTSQENQDYNSTFVLVCQEGIGEIFLQGEGLGVIEATNATIVSLYQMLHSLL